MHWVLVGYFFSAYRGIIVGLILSLMILMMIFYFGEKIILATTKASYEKNDELVQLIKNLSYKLDLMNVKVYTTHVFANNLYYCQSLYGTPSIIIGKNLFQKLTDKELEAGLWATLKYIRSNESIYRTIFNLLLMNFYFPIFMILSLFKREHQKAFFEVFYLPVYYLKAILFRNSSATFKIDREMAQSNEYFQPYKSFLYKISKTQHKGASDFSDFIMQYMNIIENKDNKILKNIIGQGISIEARIAKSLG